jgi:hypothetical protein
MSKKELRTTEDLRNNNIPSFCYDEKIRCGYGQRCSDCPRPKTGKTK